MSSQCRAISRELSTLDPFYVEFTNTKGALRRIRPSEEKAAQGMCFLCPRCKNNRQKRHYLIFLFDNAPENARPHGRFFGQVNAEGRLLHAREQTLHENKYGAARTLLEPQDVCGWRGSVIEGAVSWIPNLKERMGF